MGELSGARDSDNVDVTLARNSEANPFQGKEFPRAVCARWAWKSGFQNEENRIAHVFCAEFEIFSRQNGNSPFNGGCLHSR